MRKRAKANKQELSAIIRNISFQGKCAILNDVPDNTPKIVLHIFIQLSDKWKQFRSVVVDSKPNEIRQSTPFMDEG